MSTTEIANFTPEQIQILNDAAAALQAVANAAKQEKSVTTEVEAFNLQLVQLKQMLSVTDDTDAYVAILMYGQFNGLRLAALFNSNNEKLSGIKNLLQSAADKLKAPRIKELRKVYENIDAAIAKAALPAGDGRYTDYFLGMEGAKEGDEDITPTLDELCTRNEFPGEGIQDKEDGQIKRAEHHLITEYAKAYGELEAILKVLGEPNTTLDILDLMGTDFKLSSLEKHYHRCGNRTSPVMGSILTGTARILAMKKEQEQGDKSLKDKLLGSKTSTEFLAFIQQSSDEEKDDFISPQRLHVMEELIKQNKIEEMQILLDNKLCDVNYRNRATQQGALHCAVQQSNVAAIIFLIENGADVFAENRREKTPLTLAFKKEDPTVLLNAVLDGLAKRFDVEKNKKAKQEIEALRKQVNNGIINKDNVDARLKGLMDILVSNKPRGNSRSLSLSSAPELFRKKPEQAKMQRSASLGDLTAQSKVIETPEQIQSKLILLTAERIKSIQFPTEESLLTTKKDLQRKIDNFNRYNQALSLLEGKEFYKAKFKTEGSSVLHDVDYVTYGADIKRTSKDPKDLKDLKIIDRLNFASSLINEKDDPSTLSEQAPKKQSVIVSKAKQIFWQAVEAIMGRILEDKYPQMLTSKDRLFREAFNELWPRPGIKNQAQRELSSTEERKTPGKEDIHKAVEAAKTFGLLSYPNDKLSASSVPLPGVIEIPGTTPGSAA